MASRNPTLVFLDYRDLSILLVALRYMQTNMAAAYELGASQMEGVPRMLSAEIDLLCEDLNQDRKIRYGHYDYDERVMLSQTFATYREAVEALDQRLDNVVVVGFASGNSAFDEQTNG